MNRSSSHSRRGSSMNRSSSHSRRASSMSRPTPPHADPVESPPPKDTDEILGLRKRLYELNLQYDALTPVKEQLEDAVELLRDEIDRNWLALATWERRFTLQYGVIPFVAAIERADHYFDFKRAAKDKYQEEFNTTRITRQPSIFDVLRGDEELKSKFDKIGDTELRQATRAIYFELVDEKRAKQDKHMKKREDLAVNLPIYNLVFRAREQDIVMDQNPVVELEKIMTSNPCLYDARFRLKVPLEEYLCIVLDEDPTVELAKIMESNSSSNDACFKMSGKPVDGLLWRRQD